MNAIALQVTSDNAPAKKQQAATHRPVLSWSKQSVPNFAGPMIQRKSSCACGGDCPRCEAADKESNEPVKAALQPHYFGDLDDNIPKQVPDAGVRRPDAGTGDAGVPRPDAGTAPTCTDICNWAYADPRLNFGGGGVVCDGAVKCACAFDVPPLTRGQCPVHDRIVIRHERRHMGEVDCNPSGGLHRPPFRILSQGTASECVHRRESIAEINAALRSTPAGSACRTGMISIRDTLLLPWVRAHCGTSTPDAGTRDAATRDAGPRDAGTP